MTPQGEASHHSSPIDKPDIPSLTNGAFLSLGLIPPFVVTFHGARFYSTWKSEVIVVTVEDCQPVHVAETNPSYFLINGLPLPPFFSLSFSSDKARPGVLLHDMPRKCNPPSNPRFFIIRGSPRGHLIVLHTDPAGAFT